MFDYFPLSDKNLEFVLREGVLGEFCLDYTVDVIFASLDLLSKDLYLLLLNINKITRLLNHARTLYYETVVFVFSYVRDSNVSACG